MIKFFQKFHKCFRNNYYKLFSRFQQHFLLYFQAYFNSPHNYHKILCKNYFWFRHSSTTIFFILRKSHDIILTKLIKFSKNWCSFTNIFHKFFNVSFQTNFAISKVAEHVSSFPSAVGDHRFVISVYGQLRNKRFIPNLSTNNRRTLSIDTSSQFCLQVCTKP